MVGGVTWNPLTNDVYVLNVSGSAGLVLTLPSNLATSGNNAQKLIIYKVGSTNTLTISGASMTYLRTQSTSSLITSINITNYNACIIAHWIPGYNRYILDVY
jgi:hypothetical protein